ncbi:hypothetical protein BCR35DRAFT_301992 [Leucosporidium creatinivorum]|uniref:Extracellular membrane protein CFEM domain-containing protein n=1 Tax=Leucosporidium creatinivorum TaxID=106004 RepID=A0A1Y2FVT4_9BASI|nr:hypothetical protein BCR35DRAFT_301992 [Leucosporidium creatinivorum]
MLAQLVSLVAIASAAVAIPAPAPNSVASIGTSLTAAFNARLVKRQSTTDGLTGLQNLLQEAVQGQSSGKCQSECSPWITTVTACVNDNGSDNTAIGYCSCGSTPVQQMATCGDCFDEAQAASDFASLCSAATGGSTGSGSSGSASASGAASSASGLLSSASSRASSGIASITSAFASETSAASFSTGAGTGAGTGGGDGPSETSSAGAAATSGPASGAGRNAVVGGSALAFAGLVGALLV